MAAAGRERAISEMMAVRGTARGVVTTPLQSIATALAAGCPLWLTMDEVADFARVDQETVQELIEEGRLQAFRFAGRQLVVSVASVLDCFDPHRPGDGVSENGDENDDSAA